MVGQLNANYLILRIGRCTRHLDATYAGAISRWLSYSLRCAIFQPDRERGACHYARPACTRSFARVDFGEVRPHTYEPLLASCAAFRSTWITFCLLLSRPYVLCAEHGAGIRLSNENSGFDSSAVNNTEIYLSCS